MGVIKNLLIKILAENDDAKKKLKETEAAVAEVKTVAADAGKTVAEAIPDKPVEVKVETAATEKKLDAVDKGAKGAKDAIKKVNDETKKSPGGFFDRLAAKINTAKESSKDLKKAFDGSMFGTLLAPAAAAMAIVNSLAKIGAAAWDAYLGRLKESAERAAEVRAQMEKLQQVNDARRGSDAAALASLRQMASTEQLSNAQKAQAAALVKQLAGSYGDLGIAIDATTGKITGLDEAQAKMSARDFADRIREQERINKQLEEEIRVNRQNRDSAPLTSSDTKVLGIPASGSARPLSKLLGGLDAPVQFGGEAATMEAAAKEEAAVNALLDGRRKLRELQKQDPEKQRALAADAVIASDREQLRIQQLKNAGETEAAAKLEFTVGLRSRGVALTEKERETLWEINRQAAEETIRAEELAKAKADAAAAEEEIKRKAEERGKLYNDALSQAEYELQMATLKRQGLDDEAARLAIINELKQRGVVLSDAEIEQLLARRKAAREAADEAQKAEQDRAAAKAKSADSRAYATDAVADAEYQLELQQLKNAGLDDEADRLQLLNELKQRGLELTDDEIAKILASRKGLRELQGGKSGDRVTVGGERQETDSLRKIGLYNWGAGAANSLDKTRNGLLGQIRDGVNKLYGAGGGETLS